ncbi:8604_t:CDS:1, partial [Racocetra fulgida]
TISVLNDLTNTESFQPTNLTNDNDDYDQTTQLFQHYKLILNQALRIVEEQENIGNKR